jgi:hypothetical protein
MTLEQCVRCKKIKFDSYFFSQFFSRFAGLYTEVWYICKKCVKELGEDVALEFLESRNP